MKLNNKFLIFCFLIVLCLSSSLFSYNWPFNNGQTQHQINSTFGECRGNRNHFHNGVDIQGIMGTPVYAIEGGMAFVDPAGEGVNIGHFRYYHLRKIQIEDAQVVQSGTLIGYTNNTNHVHLIECVRTIDFYRDVPNSLCLNPLRTGGIAPFTDTVPPVVENVTLFRQGTNDTLSLNRINGQIDFAIQAYDPGVTITGAANNASRCGIYSVTIEFRDKNDNQIGEDIQYILFDNLPDNGNINWAYASGSNSSVFIYWATNDPFNDPHNKYWNTRQRIGRPYNVDARFPGEALYQDGIVKIFFVVADVSGNTTRYELRP